MADTTAASLDATRANYVALTRQRRLYGGIMLLVFVLLMASGFGIANDRNAGGFLPGLPQMFDFPAEVIAEAWTKRANLPGHIAKALPALIETLNIAAIATISGALGAILLSMLATQGLAPWPRLIPVFRRIMDLMRAIPEIVIALVLIFVLGGGPVPAAIAIGFHTVGALGKLFSEVNENADLKPLEGLSSVGATWGQRMMLGLVPQVAPNWFSYALLRFEINIRASAILGFVGAGGIGYELKNAISWGQGKFDEAAAVFILLFLTIVVFDQMSSYIRNHLTYGSVKGARK
ncbi:phosphonate ABC transporter, permease protein PhnE [Celeribacter neptunius]|uniref:Phosphonate transport system permease protein n=1 Tax=Celeribacter neptunius TaxID=588602 RepID=A0A1I3QPU0_9RHOB|nr:phosphonate ABC transporter, permease protein PhnE [Celeribacter neptunius]SFJ35539.1 phosphonate transport system permease protein [Celeribacter neptunius]